MTKEELKEYRKLLLELKGIEDTIKSISYINSPLMSEVRTNKVVSQVENIVLKVLKLEDEYKVKKEELLSKLKKVENYISLIEDTTIRDIFRRRYVLGERWEKISINLNISIQHCIRIHNKYLKK